MKYIIKYIDLRECERSQLDYILKKYRGSYIREINIYLSYAEFEEFLDQIYTIFQNKNYGY